MISDHSRQGEAKQLLQIQEELLLLVQIRRLHNQATENGKGLDKGTAHSPLNNKSPLCRVSV